MFCCYILKSLKSNKYYVGSCEDLKIRLTLHNLGKVKSTQKDRPWKLLHNEEFYTLREASRREKQIKNWKSRKAIEKLIEHKI